MAARFFQGVALAPFEALVNASVGDLYFVHERGLRMALSNLCLFGGAFFTPVIVGKMTESIGWQWTFYFIAIFSAAMLPLVIFFCPETAYVRESRYDTDTTWSRLGEGKNSVSQGSGENAQGYYSHEMKESPHGSGSMDKENAQDLTTTTGATDGEVHTPTKFNWFARSALMPFNGIKTHESFIKLTLRPFPLFFHPGMLWACLIQGALIGWTVLIGIVLAAIMLGAPLWFNEVKTGYMYTGAFIGAVLGFALAGVLSDPSVKWLTKRNGGVYEPEFRMILVIPQLIFGCAGIFGFGITANDTWKYGWFWPDFFFALEVMGMVLGAVASALYIVDAHRDLAIEGFTCLLVFKNIFSFGLTFSGYDWLVHAGIRPVFVAVGIVQAVICVTTVPMCEYSLTL